VTPERSREQRLDALAEANRRRATRALYRRELKRMDYGDAIASAVAVLTNPPAWARSWRVSDLIKSIPGYGPGKTARVGRYAHLDLARRVDQLTPLQALAVAETIATVGWTQYRRAAHGEAGVA
jgi:hypothetical protein